MTDSQSCDRESAVSDNSALAHFAYEMRWWRELRGLSQERLATMVIMSRQTVSLIELGRRWPSRDFAGAVDRELATGGVLGRLWNLVDAEQEALKTVAADVRTTDVRRLVLQLAIAVRVDLRLLEAYLSTDAATTSSDVDH